MIGNLRVHKHWAMLLGVVATLALILGMSPAVARAQEVDQTLRIQQPLSSEFYNHVKFPDGTYHDTFKPDAFVLRGVSQSDATVPTNGVGFVGKVAYCIDPEREVGGPYTKGTAQPFGDYSNSNNSTNKMRGDAEAYRKVNWIAHNTFPVKSAADVYAAAGIDAAKKPQLTRVIAGANFAMWHFSHGYDFSEATLDPETKAIYDYFTGPQNVGLDSVDSSNQTGLIFNHDDPNYQDAIIVDNETKPSGDKPEQPSTPEEPAKELKPSIATQARLDGNKVVAGAVVKDTVAFKDLVAGKQYHLDAKLVNKNNENEVLGTGSLDFKAEAAEGEKEVIITVSDDVTVPVESAVAFEKLTSTEVNADGTENTTGESVEIATHENINDSDQTVHGDTLKPEISTQADLDGDQIVKGSTVVDTVHFKDLVVGKNYTLNAQLVNKAKADEVLGKGMLEFKPEATEGDVKVSIPVADDVTKPVAAAVAFESLVSAEVNADGTPNTSGEAVEVAKHQDINDANQTVTGDVPEEPEQPVTPEEPAKELNPEISTQAELNGDQVVKGSTVVDTVHFKDLVVGKKYTLNAELRNKANAEQILGKGTLDFTPDVTEGDVKVSIPVADGVTTPVEAAVAYERLTSADVDKAGKPVADGKELVIAVHENINDEKQTVTSKPEEKPAPEEPKNPSVKTKAELVGDQVVAGSTVNDTVTFTDLVPDKGYTLHAQLINKADGKTVIGEGSKTFTPDAANGSVVVPIKVHNDVTEAVESAVAFEELTSKVVDAQGKDVEGQDDNPIADHKDLTDKDQTVTSKPEEKPAPEEPKNPSVKTKAELVEEQISAGATVNDTVTFTDLVPGKEYTLHAQLINKADGKTVIGEGSKTFTPDAANGSVVVPIKVHNDVTEAVESAVAFEELTSKVVDAQGKDVEGQDDNAIADHKDLTDQDQTVTSKPEEKPAPEEPAKELKPSIKTLARLDGNKVVAGAVVKDTVAFKDLVAGKQYHLDAKLVNKNNKDEVLGTGSLDFKAEAANGEQEVIITVSEDVTVPVESAVAFEKLTSTEVNADGTENTTGESVEIATHENINDADQTVHGDTLKPEISTQANTNADQIAAGAVIVDTVHFKDLVVGKNYTLNAQLINKADEVLGKGMLEFKPEATEGDVKVSIPVADDVTKPVAAAVAFESLVSAEVNADGTPNTSGEAVEVAKHQDINDANQTVTGDVPEEPDVDVEGKEPTKEPKNPSIKTKAELVGDQVVAGSTVNDTVTFTDLVPDKGYTLHAQLINKADGKTVIGEGSKTFTPDAANGSVVVPIKVHNDVTEAVESAVAFEELTSKVVDAQGKDVEGQDDNAIANHKDLTDKDQTVTSKPKEEPAPEDSKEPTPPEEMTKPLNPSIETVANLKENQIVAGSTVVDTVKFEDLVPDKTYVLNAELINKADNSVIGHGAASFEAKTSSGSVNVEITVDKNVTKPVAEAVAFEKMTSTEVNPDGTDNFSGQPVDIADHQDINDENQTVIGDVPETEEGDTPPAEDNEDNTAPSNKQPTSSVPATPSKPETNEPNVDVEGKEPTNKPDTPMDQVKPDESKPDESKPDESKPDQSKPDQSKPDQSKPDESKPDQSEPTESKPAEPNVDVQGKEPMKPTITTSAGIKGQANVEKGNVVIDTVHFTGLKPGTKYTLHGELMCKETGKSTGATGSIDFVPTSANGSVDVPITITDGQCKEQVAFETLTDVNGKEVAVHKDINSASQTVTDGKAPVTPEETTPATPEQTPGAEGGNNAASTTNNIGTVIGQNNVNVTIIGGTGQAKVKDHGHALAPNTERRTIKNVPSGPTGLATHAMPNVATK